MEDSERNEEWASSWLLIRLALWPGGIKITAKLKYKCYKIKWIKRSMTPQKGRKLNTR